MKELTRPYILRVTIGYGIGEAGRRYDICKVEQVRNHKATQPLNTYDRSGFYHKSIRLLILSDFIGCWDSECHLCIYNADDFTHTDGILID